MIYQVYPHNDTGSGGYHICCRNCALARSSIYVVHHRDLQTCCLCGNLTTSYMHLSTDIRSFARTDRCMRGATVGMSI